MVTLPFFPSDFHSVVRSECFTQDPEQVIRRAAVGQKLNRGLVDVVVLIVVGLFLECVDEYLKVSLSDAAEELIGCRVVQVNHGKMSSKCGASLLRLARRH